MAIWYINPYTTVSGNGTFSNAFSLSAATKAGIASGDQIRVISVPLANLLKPTIYTASYSSSLTQQYLIIITSGGNLGADFASQDVLYFPDYNTFAKITTVSGNTLSINTSYACLPIANTAATTVNVRKVDVANNGYSANSSSIYFANTSIFNNLTISDGWISANTQITDGSVVSLVNNGYVGTSHSIYLDSSISGTLLSLNINLSQTYIISMNTASWSYAYLYMNGSNSSYSLAQQTNYYVPATGGGVQVGSATFPVQNTTINITNATGGGSYIYSIYGSNVSLSYGNVITNYIDGGLSMPAGSCNGLTLNVNNIICAPGSAYNTSCPFTLYNAYNTTININGIIDQAGVQISYFSSGYGYYNINTGPNFSVKYNKRASTQTTWSAGIYFYGSLYVFAGGNKMNVPIINPPSGHTFTNTYNFGSYGIYGSGVSPNSRTYRIPNITNIDLPVPSTSTLMPYGYTMGNNFLLTYKNGADPMEMLSPQGNGYQATAANTVFPNVTKDYTTYRTSAPSLRSLLTTRTTGYWQTQTGATSNTKSFATKTIKVPLTNGVPITVSGYIRTDDTLIANGDCIMSLFANNTVLASQAMTTNSINNWEQFTLSITPTANVEGYLLWDMYYENGAKSFWLDDLTVS